MTAEYPRRDSYYAHKLVRLMVRSCAAQEIGVDGFALVTIVAHTEDAKRYSGAVTFWNDQLTPLLGFRSWEQLDRARKRAVSAGWLHYEAGGKGKVGKYWTLIPDDLAGIPDGDSSCDHQVSIPEITDESLKETGKKPDRSLKETGKKPDRTSEHSSLSLNPIPSPPPIKSRALRFDAIDESLADEMIAHIRELDPSFVGKDRDAWVNDFRLMRERDNHKAEDIRQVMAWVYADSFWRTNILSPAKLRKQWLQLFIKMKTPSNGKPAETPFTTNAPTNAGRLQ